ncbi:MAG: hypothetical protein Q8R05_07420 [Candidatus Omnitrophota bacterium]|nr:hypothetical protein [Candidatus Omnitrophota bacterium]
MGKFLLFLAVVAGLVLSTQIAGAETIWSEDFSDVSDWGVVFDPGGGSVIKRSNGLDSMQSDSNPAHMAALYVDKEHAQAAFSPNPVGSNFIPFDPAKKSEYTLKWKVDRLTTSVSWDIAIDEFNANKKYINTIWSICTANNEAGKEFSKNLGNKGWSASTKYVIPKISLHSGDAAQTAYLSYMSLEKASK